MTEKKTDYLDVNLEAANRIWALRQFVLFNHVRASRAIIPALEIAAQLTELESSREIMDQNLADLTEKVRTTTLNYGEISDKVSPECYGLDGKTHEDCSYAKNVDEETGEPLTECICTCHHPDYYPDR